ncbi:MAG: hypothetical protein SP1CHLAM54_01040 [Chlamydiia bacterium]|nr:hypothetical protein [Chlamydiia bacterium]MCH9615026.1 hypothetical protein [Chlamydiia bacterium]MCH9629923.1 hypothetical protein [Chlamydiia bacterium]
MKKWLLALCISFLVISTFFKTGFCFVVKQTMSELEAFDYDRLIFHRHGLELRGVRMRLSVGKLSAKKVRIPYGGKRTPVIYKPLLKLSKFERDTNPWFLDLNVEMRQGQVIFPHFDEVVDFSLKSGVMQLKEMMIEREGITFKKMSLPWLTRWLELPLVCKEGTLEGYTSHDFKKYNLCASDVAGEFKGLQLSAKRSRLSDTWDGEFVDGRIAYKGRVLEKLHGKLGAEIQVSAQMDEKELSILGTKLGKRASLGVQFGDFEGNLEVNRDHLEGQFADCLSFKYADKVLQFEGDGVPSKIYNSALSLFDITWTGKGEVDCTGSLSKEKSEMTLFVKKGTKLDFGSLQIAVNEEKPIHCAYKEGNARVYGTLSELTCDYKDLSFTHVGGNFHLEEGKVSAYGIYGKLGKLDLLAELSLYLDDTPTEIDVTQIRGSLQEAATLLGKNLPIGGDFTGRLIYNESGWQGTVLVDKGSLPLHGKSGIEDLSFKCDFSKEFILSNVHANLALRGLETPQFYPLSAPKIVIDEDFACHFDVKMEAKTHDLFRLAGAFTPERLLINTDLTHLFGTKFEKFECQLKEQKLAYLDLMANLSFHDLLKHVELLKQFGVKIKDDLSDLDLKGDAKVKVLCTQDGDHFEFHSSNCTYNRESFPVHIAVEKQGAYLQLKQAEFGAFRALGNVEKIVDIWELTGFSITRGNSRFCISEGELRGNKLSLKFDDTLINLKDFKAEDGGQVFASGELTADLHHRYLTAKLDVSADNFLKADLNVRAKKPLNISYSKDEGLVVQNTKFAIKHKDLWAECGFERFMWKNQVSGKGFSCVLPPEMCMHLAKTSVLPIEMRGDKLVIGGSEFKWENQIELEAHFVYDQTLSLQGRLKNGYYWIKDVSYPLSDAYFDYEGGRLEVSLQTEIFKQPIGLSALAEIGPNYTAEIRIKDPKGNTLTLQSQKEKPVQSVEGKCFGFDCSFYQGNTGGLSGQIKINFPELLPLISEEMREKFLAFGLGSGYEIAGDIVFGTKPHFEGYLKGKDFECLGSRLKTFMGHLYADLDHISIDHLKVSDEAALVFIKELSATRHNDQWHLKMPSLTVQDFRPSLLKKIGKFRGNMKPLIIRDLSFHNVEGTIGDNESFIGFGEMHFTNTFREEMHLLELPLELIARIGLDPKILVPIKGTIDFEMRKGKVYLTELKNSHSDGKRSKFYLARSRPSYIDLNGDIDISIKMRQYVILKVTEPFILSIGGTLAKPKFGLR